MHGVSILSKIGILLYEFSQIALANPASKALKFFWKEFVSETELKGKDECQHLLTTIAARCETSLAMAENITCKSYQMRAALSSELVGEKDDDDGDHRR